MLQGWAFLMGGIKFSLIFRPWQIDYVPTAMGAFGIFTVVVLGNVLAFSLYLFIGPQKAISICRAGSAAIISTLVLGSADALGFGCLFDAGGACPQNRKIKYITKYTRAGLT